MTHSGPFSFKNVWEEVRVDNSEDLVDNAVRERMSLIEDSEGPEHYNWFWIAMEDLYGLDEVENPDLLF